MKQWTWWRLRFQSENGQLTVQWADGYQPPVYHTFLRVGRIKRNPLYSIYCHGDPMVINYLPTGGADGFIEFRCQQCTTMIVGNLQKVEVRNVNEISRCGFSKKNGWWCNRVMGHEGSCAAVPRERVTAKGE